MIADMISYAPAWLIQAAGAPRTKDENAGVVLGELDTLSAVKRATAYLLEDAPTAVEGAGGDATTYAVANRVMDFGISVSQCFELMADHWNDRCDPPWNPEDLETKIDNAKSYRNSPIGSANPGADFSTIEMATEETLSDDHPLVKLNNEYAFVLAGNTHHILWETKDIDGRYSLRHLTEPSFHAANIAHKVTLDSQKPQPMTKVWMNSKQRRSYKGICFRPGKQSPPEWYNLWKGFAYEPAADEPVGDSLEALELFKEHVLENICAGSQPLYRWLIGYFAHLVQRPWEKPLVALVFKGGKGTGKNAMVERIGALLGHHFLVTSNRRFIVGNFNGHMENLLLFVLDEAFWSGDKQAEGQLKDLITGSHHVIEHKGQESYRVENLTRVVIIGNEDWLVPATADERRFAVFAVGDGRKQDREYFLRMRTLMENGGYPHLLKWLQDPAHLVGVDVNCAPDTEALRDQKLASLDSIARWWFDCLRSERIVGVDFAKEWPEKITTEDARGAFIRYCKNHRMAQWAPNEWQFGKDMAKMCEVRKKRLTHGGEREYYYLLPGIEDAKNQFQSYLGHDVEW